MAKRKQDNPQSLKQIATGLVQAAEQDVELAVEQLRGAAADVLEKVTDTKPQPARRTTARSAKKPTAGKPIPPSARAKSKVSKRRKSTAATRRGKR